MNWYKKAKLVNKKSPDDEGDITVCCMYCHRWATHPVNEDVPREEYEWKIPKDLDEEEDYMARKTLENNDVSSSICPVCFRILKENRNIKPSQVGELSLAS